MTQGQLLLGLPNSLRYQYKPALIPPLIAGDVANKMTQIVGYEKQTSSMCFAIVIRATKKCVLLLKKERLADSVMLS